MLDIKELSKALKQVAEEKGLEPRAVMEAVEASLAAAYKREYGDRNEVVKCEIDEKSGALKFWQVKTVVDETTVRFPTPEEIAEEEERAKAAAEGKEGERNQKSEIRNQAAAESAEDEEPKLPRFNA